MLLVLLIPAYIAAGDLPSLQKANYGNIFIKWHVCCIDIAMGYV